MGNQTVPVLLACATVLLCLSALALIGTFLDRSRAPVDGEEAKPPAPAAPQSVSDPERAARRAASAVAAASDTGGPIIEIPPCRRALADPTESRCADYETALRDFLEDARRPCIGPGHARLKDLSCVRNGGYFGLLQGHAFRDPSRGDAP